MANSYFRTFYLTFSGELKKMNAPAYFTIETLVVDDGRKLGKGIRNKDGYFPDVPVAVLGTVTRNKTSYDSNDFLKQIKGPDTSFSMRLNEGTLFGEMGHPFVDLNSPMGLQRLLHLEPTRESNHIHAVKIKHLDDLGLDVIMIDTKGTGPYGKYFDEAMEDPTRNVAFSLRGISKAETNRQTGVTHKHLINLVTFDSMMASGGFKEAAKRYMAAKEDFHYESSEILNVPVTQKHLTMIQSVALESFTNSELNELMKSNKVVLGTRVAGYVDLSNQCLIDPDTHKSRGLFRSFVTVKR